MAKQKRIIMQEELDRATDLIKHCQATKDSNGSNYAAGYYSGMSDLVRALGYNIRYTLDGKHDVH